MHFLTLETTQPTSKKKTMIGKNTPFSVTESLRVLLSTRLALAIPFPLLKAVSVYVTDPFCDV